jgi:hypothetical protein
MSDNSPKFGVGNFICPHCAAVSQQTWFAGQNASDRILKAMQMIFHEYRSHLQSYQEDAIKAFMQHMQTQLGGSFKSIVPNSVAVSICVSCDEPAIWVDKNIVYPAIGQVDDPNKDLSEEIAKIYLEAASIVKSSPRGAAALLRLALQKLLIQIGKVGKNINNDIKELVSEGLSPKIQKALDLLRVVGNNAVHPGQIDIEDNSEVAIKLFHVLNLIAYEMITRPKEIDDLYDDLVPDETKVHISNRDGKNT